MSSCQNCGAPIAFAGATATCTFCDAVNQAPPRQVQVAVPVQVIHQTVHVTSTGGSAPTGLMCPQCGRRLATVRVKEVELHGCGTCGGIWVDNESAQAMVKAPDAVFEDLARRCGTGARARRKRTDAPTCAVCRAPLDGVVSSVEYLNLDICRDHGTWFDAFELSTMIRALLSKPKAGPAPKDVACIGCNTKIAVSESNITGRGPMCEKCWRTEEARQLESGSDTSLFAANPNISGVGQFADPSVANRDRAAAGVAVGAAAVGALFDTNQRSRR